MAGEGSSLPIQGIRIDWDLIGPHSYLRGIGALQELDHLAFTKNITLFVGENGSGKSTLLEAIAVSYGFNPEGGTRNYHFSTYDSHSELCDALTLTRGFGMSAPMARASYSWCRRASRAREYTF